MNGQDFKKLIEEAGFKSQAQFARKIGKSQNIVSSWINKNNPPTFAILILEIFSKLRKISNPEN